MVDFLAVLAAVSNADETARRAFFDRVVAMLAEASVDVRKRGALFASQVTLPASYTSRLAVALSDANEQVRFGAAWALVRQGPDAVAALDQLLLRFEDDHDPTRDRAAWAVSNIGAPAIPRLIELLGRPSVRTRALAVGCMGNIVSIPRDRSNALSDAQVRSLAETLLAVINDREPWVRFNALEAFSQLEQRLVLPAMVELLDAEGDYTRERAALCLCWASPQLTPEAVSALERHLSEDNRAVRHHAAEALRRMGRLKENQ
ncbi:MAG TPA: HEAT repeat domain-containing protein [Tepidisphaeraceae bacterium]|jgi:HEAT repeat protein